MGLFDFARNIGNKLFGSEDEAPQKIKEHIEEENPGVSNLDVSVEDGVATISGQADSAEAMEKAVLMAGNVKGISGVRADGLSAPAPVHRHSAGKAASAPVPGSSRKAWEDTRWAPWCNPISAGCSRSWAARWAGHWVAIILKTSWTTAMQMVRS